MKQKNILVTILPLLLTIALLTPVLLQLTHIFKKHEHSAYSDYSVHFHKKKNNCTLHTLHLTSFHHASSLVTITSASIEFHNIFPTSSCSILSNKFDRIPLRGPPKYS